MTALLSAPDLKAMQCPYDRAGTTGAQGVETTMATHTTVRLPWQFFVGPDGVVLTPRGSDRAATHVALVNHGLAERIGH